MSNGPVVSKVNINSSGIDANANIIVTFDQAISQTQDMSKLASIVGATQPLAEQPIKFYFNCTTFLLVVHFQLILVRV